MVSFSRKKVRKRCNVPKQNSRESESSPREERAAQRPAAERRPPLRGAAAQVWSAGKNERGAGGGTSVCEQTGERDAVRLEAPFVLCAEDIALSPPTFTPYTHSPAPTLSPPPGSPWHWHSNTVWPAPFHPRTRHNNFVSFFLVNSL